MFSTTKQSHSMCLKQINEITRETKCNVFIVACQNRCGKYLLIRKQLKQLSLASTDTQAYFLSQPY